MHTKSDPKLAQAADSLSRLLADTYTLYLKTHNFHWNVTGPMFQTLHLSFEAQYNELAQAVDLLAERIRALGFRAPGSYSEYAKLSCIQESTTTPKAQDMISELWHDQEKVIRTAQETFDLAEKIQDQATMEIVIMRIQSHQKTAWMLKSHLED